MYSYGSLLSMFSCNFVFFKQKTAYELRISDWSSDVCSSDLEGGIADDEGHVCRGVARNVQRNTFQLANLERLAIVEQLVELRAVAFEVGTGVEQLTKH